MSLQGVSASFEVAPLDTGRYLVSEGKHRRCLFIAGPPQTPTVFFNGTCYDLEVAREGSRRSQRAGPHDLLESPMPATVAQILVHAGQHVERGQTLLMLEAMKMEMPIRAPHPGLVHAIRCEVGELVQPGIALIELTSEI